MENTRYQNIKATPHTTTTVASRQSRSSAVQRIADGDSCAITECSSIYGNLIWTWSRKFTDSANDAETAAIDILTDILNSAKDFDPAKCSETTFIKQICIRRLMKVDPTAA